jgi:hypothetical protein
VRGSGAADKPREVLLQLLVDATDAGDEVRQTIPSCLDREELYRGLLDRQRHHSSGFLFWG